jgi:hypothetical protein
MTGHEEFLAERDAMKAAAVVATERWHDRLGELRDALDGVALADTDDQLLMWLARTEGATAHALDLFERIKRGAYPDLNADHADLRARRERERERAPDEDRTHVDDPDEET